MISVKEGLALIQEHSLSFGVEEVSYKKSVGRTLAEDIKADRDFPPFNRATMDGIAISLKDWQTGQRTFPISGEQFAGSPQLELASGTCMEVMTGAVVPMGADVVIRYEDLEIESGEATVQLEEVKEWLNIHLQGTDSVEGDVLIPFDKIISYGDIGILTSVGKESVLVKKLPQVAIISTGDELVEPSEIPLPHQIRKSNVYNLGVLLDKEGIKHSSYHLNDEWDEIIVELASILRDYDLILMSGGVSKGKKDFIPEALEHLGVTKHFHRLMQRPGKPLWFGTNDTTTVFGLPGNPVSTLVCYLVYVKRWLSWVSGGANSSHMAILTSEVKFEKELTYFIPVSVSNEDGLIRATPFPGHGSGDLVNLSNADGFLELDASESVFKEGEVYPLHLF